MATIRKHCKITYEVISEYTKETNKEIIKVDGVEYTIEYLPRPCANVSDLFCVFVGGIRYSTFAKFLKTVKTRANV